jgi:hypothetical protein
MRKQILRERGALGVVGASNKEIPSWLKFPDSDRVEWLNQVSIQTFVNGNILVLLDATTAMALHK